MESDRFWLSDSGDIVCERSYCAGAEAAKTMSIVTDRKQEVYSAGIRYTILTGADLREFGVLLQNEEGKVPCACGRLEYVVRAQETRIVPRDYLYTQGSVIK
jgi:hypothetical protein